MLLMLKALEAALRMTQMSVKAFPNTDNHFDSHSTEMAS